MVLPQGLARLGARVFTRLPEPMAARLLPARIRYRPDDLPVATAQGTPVRLLIAPVNFAGQAWEWARAAERGINSVSAVTMAYSAGTGYGFSVDTTVPASAYVLSRSWHRRQREAILEGFSHVLIEAERNPFGAVYEETLDEQVRQLEAAGIRVAFLCHGTDLRVPSQHAARHTDSPFADPTDPATQALERDALRNREAVARLGLPVFVSTPDMLLDVPGATWLPVVVDADRWEWTGGVLDRDRPVVVHAPSSGPIKGSDLIDPVMARLDAEGLVTYRRLTGVPAAEMPAAYRDADIILDQFRLGDYGVAACEGMLAGRVVIGNVTDAARDFVRESTALELPIVQATATELREVVLSVLDDRERFRAVAADGRLFARAVHDGRASADALRGFLTST